MNFETEIEQILCDDEVKALKERARKEIARLRECGNPETKRAIDIVIYLTMLIRWDPESKESLTDKEHISRLKQVAERAIKELSRLLDEKRG